MRVTATLGLFVIMAFSAPAFSQSFLGDRTATADTPNGKVSETLKVKKTKAGFLITARLVKPVPGSPEAGPGTDIELNGNRFLYKRMLMTPNGPIVITYTGVVTGDSFTGTVDIGGFAQAPYNGVRVKPSG